jgi:hypothetical protein
MRLWLAEAACAEAVCALHGSRKARASPANRQGVSLFTLRLSTVDDESPNKTLGLRR